MLVTTKKGYIPNTFRYVVTQDITTTNGDTYSRSVLELSDLGEGLKMGTASCIPLGTLKDAHVWAVELAAALENIARIEGIQL